MSRLSSPAAGGPSPIDAARPIADSRPLRIALVARSGELFGAERSLLRLALGFAQWPDFRPLVTVPHECSLSGRCREYGIDVLVSDYRQWSSARRRPLASLRQHARSLRAWPKLLQRLARFGPDVIYTSTASVPIGALAARNLGVGHVWHLQELFTADGELGCDSGWPFSRRLIGSGYNRLVVNSDAVRTFFSERLDRHDITTIYEGFDFPPLPAATGAEKYQAQITEAPVIELLTVGALMPGKGQDDAILAVADLIQRGRRIHLRLAGDGDPDYIAHLQNLVRRHRLEQSVSFLGFVHDLRALYEQAAVTVVPARAEGFGRPAVESLSYGTPVIGTDAGGLPEIVRPGRTGLLYPPGDWRALSDRLQALVQDRELYIEIATTGVAWTRQRFPARRYIREMGEFLTRAAIRRRPQLERILSQTVTPLPCPKMEGRLL